MVGVGVLVASIASVECVGGGMVGFGVEVGVAGGIVITTWGEVTGRGVEAGVGIRVGSGEQAASTNKASETKVKRVEMRENMSRILA